MSADPADRKSAAPREGSLDVASMIGSHDIVLITLDSLRFDVATSALATGQTPNLARLLPSSGWQARHTPGSFTLPAHQAFLTGFLPTPLPDPNRSGRHRPPRLFAGEFEGARGLGPATFVFAEPTLPAALAARGYRTICVGGVGFFSGRGALGSALPALFEQSHWSRATSVHHPDSAAHAFARAADLVTARDDAPTFLLLNIAATHTPTHCYLPGARRDSPQSQAAALAHVDEHLPVLLAALGRRRPTLLIVCADHGTCFGEDGIFGHGVAHPLIWTVPYLQTVLPVVPPPTPPTLSKGAEAAR